MKSSTMQAILMVVMAIAAWIMLIGYPIRAVNTKNIVFIPAKYFHIGIPVYEIGENED